MVGELALYLLKNESAFAERSPAENVLRAEILEFRCRFGLSSSFDFETHYSKSGRRRKLDKFLNNSNLF